MVLEMSAAPSTEAEPKQEAGLRSGGGAAKTRGPVTTPYPTFHAKKPALGPASPSAACADGLSAGERSAGLGGRPASSQREEWLCV